MYVVERAELDINNVDINSKGYLFLVDSKVNLGNFSEEWGNQKNLYAKNSVEVRNGVELSIKDKKPEVNQRGLNPAITITTGFDEPTCNGGCDGSAYVTNVSGGTSPYNGAGSYNWSPNTSDCGAIAGDFTSTITNIGAGNFTVYIEDAAGDYNYASVNVTEPAAVTWIPILDEPDCNGGTDGSIFLIMTGGTAPFDYEWDDASSQTDNPAIDLGEGTYSVTVTDFNGCSATDSHTLNAPTGLVLTLDGQNDISCTGNTDGAISISVSGGTAGYTYNWTTGDGCGVSVGDQDQSNLCAGTYDVTITDSSPSGCTVTGNYTLTEPATSIGIVVDLQDDISCNGGSDGEIQITTNGGTPTYTYSWTGPGGFTSTDEDISGLQAGTYDLTITDDGPGAGCTETTSITLTEPAPIVITETITDVDCNGASTGEIAISISGGTSPYSYIWSGPGSFSSTDEDITGLVAGTYDITVTDSEVIGCTATGSYLISEPTAVTVTDVITGTSCNGGDDGAIDLTVSGGTPGYTYTWSS
ncbi:MAG: hypothetical protein C0594_13690 [Marinilabiliales bacterium]|nr:MAG: hypothetical protein C0594_13690 [Marinilabiliales bacterium]